VPAAYRVSLRARRCHTVGDVGVCRPCVHVEAGLPSADSAGKDLERRAKLGPSEFADVTRLELWQKVNLVWVQHFGWQGEGSFGAEIALVLADDDLLVDALAEFLWANRNKVRTDIDEDHDHEAID
jgi:hypothetical protein